MQTASCTPLLYLSPKQASMKVFKFGGASVKDAESVKNVARILERYSGERLVVVVSAMGKTTNLLELIAQAWWNGNSNLVDLRKQLEESHLATTQSLFPSGHPIETTLHNTLAELDWQLEEAPTGDYDKAYDQMVSTGELLATHILAAYLNEQNIPCTWLDARDLIRTDESWREGKVDWTKTTTSVKSRISDQKETLFLTQGFLGGTDDNYTTTLGREGSDYTAAILAHCLDATDVLIWKDVPGVLQGDPKFFPEARILPSLSFQDAIELAFYGASVIHPKTIKPLQNKNITLWVKSFLDPDSAGTRISNETETAHIPCYIFKRNQVLLSIFPRDFSFIVEDRISHIFRVLSEHKLKVNLMQNSAISFSVCIDRDERRLEAARKELHETYKTLFNEDVSLYTIRYYDQESEKKVIGDRSRLLEQRSRHTLQVVTTEKA
jgi:aspartate kinase